MKLAPIVMFVYNRADHFEQTYEALCQCDEAKESELYIFSDGAKKQLVTAQEARAMLSAGQRPAPGARLTPLAKEIFEKSYEDR